MARGPGLIPGKAIASDPWDDPWIVVIDGRRYAIGRGAAVWKHKASAKAALTHALRDRRCLPKEEFYRAHTVEFMRLSTWRKRNANAQ